MQLAQRNKKRKAKVVLGVKKYYQPKKIEKAVSKRKKIKSAQKGKKVKPNLKRTKCNQLREVEKQLQSAQKIRQSKSFTRKKLEEMQTTLKDKNGKILNQSWKI